MKQHRSNPASGMTALQTQSLAKQAGITLLELMIALSLGLLVSAAIASIYLGSNQTYRVQENSARMQETGRYALDLIGRSLRQAGYNDIPVTPLATKTTFAGTPINGLNTICPAGTPTTDMVTAQFDGIAGEQDCQGGTILANEIVQHTFHIENNTLRCNATRNTAAPAVPTTCPTAGTGVEMVENVEDFQVLYGIDSDGDQSADQYTATPANWAQVITARVCVLVRSTNQGIVTASQTYLNCEGALGSPSGGAATTTATDTLLRRAFVATFSLRNRVSRQP